MNAFLQNDRKIRIKYSIDNAILPPGRYRIFAFSRRRRGIAGSPGEKRREGRMRKQCTACGGAGQIAYFQGVSRFLLTWEECPQCGGTGYCPAGKKDGPQPGKKAGADGGRRSGKKKRG
jgi:DnaJ-class molecular chaperone